MILDSLEQTVRYHALDPRLGRGLDVLRAMRDLAALPAGRHPIDGERLYVSIDDAAGRGRDGARLEVHRRYIDIQVVLEGIDTIGWRSLATCSEPAGPFDPSRDVGFFADPPEDWFTLSPGRFAVFFPDDAHAPLGGNGPVRKAVIKVRLD
jgi:YhcH/YjgK/YiaL family protein